MGDSAVNAQSQDDATRLLDPIQPDRSKAFSHLITGIVLRAFAAHRRYRATREAGELLKSLFQAQQVCGQESKGLLDQVEVSVLVDGHPVRARLAVVDRLREG